MSGKGGHEIAHWLGSKAVPGYVGGECRAVGQMSRPVQHLLAGTFDAGGRARDSDGQLVGGGREFRLLRRQPHAAYHVAEFAIGGREIERALGLHLQRGG
jgi:hypothetical protein